MRASMSEERDPLCFQCSQPVTSPPRINYLADGDPCPACHNRFVDSLPPLLPGEFGAGIEEGEFPELEVAEHENVDEFRGGMHPGDNYPDDSRPA